MIEIETINIDSCRFIYQLALQRNSGKEFFPMGEPRKRRISYENSFQVFLVGKNSVLDFCCSYYYYYFPAFNIVFDFSPPFPCTIYIFYVFMRYYLKL